jgi:Ulp1 family protease
MEPLTDAEYQRYRNAVFGKGAGENEILVSREGINLTRKIMERLQPGIWLNDELINFHNRIVLAELDKKLCLTLPGRKRSHFFSSHFIPTLIDEKNVVNRNKRGKLNYKNVERWAKRVTSVDGLLFNLAFLFVPYNEDNCHWTLVVVAFSEKKIVYYDSMNGQRADIVNHVVEYLRLHHHDCGYTDPFPDWDIILKPSGSEFTDHYSECPSQSNGRLQYLQCETTADRLN